jgi:UDP-glucose 4-epimerase
LELEVVSRVLITGGAGFIGSALCRAIGSSAHDVDVSGFDDDSRGNLERLRADCPRFLAWRGSVASAETVESLFGNACPDTVWHLAAINGTASFYARPRDVLDVQLRGTQNVIDACVRHDVGTLVLFSSSEVYQSATVIPTPEDVPLSIPDVTNPRYSYAIGKLAAEAMVWWSTIEKTITIRPHNVFGPNMGYDHVIPEMIRDMSRLPNGATYAIKNAMATRSFIYIDDFVGATLRIHESVTARDGRVGEIFHVGTEDEVTIGNLAWLIAELLGKRFEWSTAEGAQGGTMRRCPDTRKLRSLGWQPKVSLREGLERTVAAYLEKREEWPA